ncbi:PepSY domain-containing protein [Aromatoleum sp.]|uniref:PepSY domain-containing protein n=1 Tax=Aromatoleum sp. TaxID=2307007 RepID=UPI002FC84731
MHLSAFVVAAVFAAGLVPSAGVAGESDHDRARQALERGEVLPLRAILDKVARDYPGDVVEVELEREHGTWIYEIELIGGDGRLVKLEIDARSAAVLRVKGRDARREGR